MATEKHNHSRRSRRQHAQVAAANWMLVLASQTVAKVAIVVVERLLGVPR